MKRVLLALFGVIVVGAFAFTFLASKREAHETLPALARRVGVQFPAEATLLGARSERGLDELVAFKVELPRASLPAFLQALPIPARPVKEAHFGPDGAFWDPSQASFVHYYEGRVDGRATKLGVAATAGGRVLVYVESFTT